MNQRPRTAAIVEDDPELRRLVRKHLESMGFAVTEFQSGRLALREIQANPPDLICLDLMLPEMSGYLVCEALRRSIDTKNVPVLVISARTLPEDRAYAEEVGATAYLSKPFTRKAFTSVVESLLAPRKEGA
jgi:DNA-binding response OmpR family regulator